MNDSKAPKLRLPDKIWYRLVSVGSALICLIAIGSQVWANLSDTDGVQISYTSLGKLSNIYDGSPEIMISEDDALKEKKFQVSRDVAVSINNQPSTLDDLQPGDDVSVKKDDRGRIVSVQARHAEQGIFWSASQDSIVISPDYVQKKSFKLLPDSKVILNGSPATIADLHNGDQVVILPSREGDALKLEVSRISMFSTFWTNFQHNLFKPLLMFFYFGFSVPLLRIAFEFPKAIYQGLTIYLLLSIGWHGGEELAVLSAAAFQQALYFILVGFATNFVLGIMAYGILRFFVPRLRKVDAATVSAYYGSDSAGTFVTCLGVLQAAHIAFAAYMPVMLAVMEIPGCLVGLYLVSRLRKKGMDSRGNMPDEPGYRPPQGDGSGEVAKKHGIGLLFREVFLNPGLFLLFAGIIVGYVSRLQGYKVVEADDNVFISLFQGFLCLFLLEMGMTASKRLRDLTTASWRFIAFGLLVPNLFALIGLCVAQCLSHAIHQPFQLGTYVLFSVLCAAASYIAVPAIQRIAIPEASPSLPLAASLGLTFTYNVTVGIPIYIVIAQQLMIAFPLK